MTTFDKREQEFERKFVLDEELRFKATARRDRLLGMWAAEKIGLTGEAAATYARNLVIADLDKPGGGDALKRVAEDLSRHGIPEPEVQQKITEFMLLAVKQIHAGQ